MNRRKKRDVVWAQEASQLDPIKALQDHLLWLEKPYAVDTVVLPAIYQGYIESQCKYNSQQVSSDNEP